jgi:ubiquinone/menaquinone biosynthesis C-methylase UbiE
MERLFLAFVLLFSCRAQDQHPVTKRDIAPVMGADAADWLTRPEREAEEHPRVALDQIGIRKGSTVADIGAGNGFYTLLLAERVGPAGKVYANDIQPEMLKLLDRRVREQGLKNVIPVLGVEDDPKLPAGSIDVALLVDVYHEFSKPQIMIRKLRESLKSDGRLVLLEFRAEDANVPIRPEHKMTVKQVRAEIEPEGFKLIEKNEKLPWQHILIFGKTI